MYFFSFYLIIYLFIILFVGFASITWKCEELWCNSVIMKEISLDTLWNLNDPQILFQNLQSKKYWWKNTLPFSKVPIYYEIETFTKKSTWSLKMTPFFDFLDNIKNRSVVCLDHIPPPGNCLRRKRHEGSTWLKESHDNHFKLKAHTFF